MLTVNKEIEGGKVTISLKGRLDINAVSQAEAELRPLLGKATELIIDMKDLKFLATDAMRVLLSAQKQMNRQGRMRLINVGETVLDNLETTGFVDIFYIAD
ncbi:MAG: STAS domain-containing protein [Ruminococcaceae bacterium]|jgi:anti-sigma B factor antagonist|nr:STAS domain-containing protein [Oscillospiraceae bacterium]